MPGIKLSWRRIAGTVTIVLVSSSATAAQFAEFDGDRFCPAGHRLMSYSFAQLHKDTICNSLQDWTIARLAGDGSFSGPANNCEIYSLDHRELGSSLCVMLGEDYSSIRGVLLHGGFRSQDDLNAMSEADWRQALIIELANRTAGTTQDYDGLDNTELAGAGELYLSLEATKRVTPVEMARLDLDEIRQTLIFELNRQTGIPVGELGQQTDLELIELLRKG